MIVVVTTIDGKTTKFTKVERCGMRGEHNDYIELELENGAEVVLPMRNILQFWSKQ